MRFSDYVHPNGIKVPMLATTRWEAIEELFDFAASESSLGDRDTILAKIRHREGLSPHGTYIQNGVAVPHYSGPECCGEHLIIGKLSAPIDWATDEACPTPVQIVVLTIVHGGPQSTYFLVTRIDRILRSPRVRDTICAARTAIEVHACLMREDEVVAQAEALPEKGVRLWKTLN